MSQFFQIHAENPQARLVKQAVEIIQKGGLVVLPTDCAYVLVCHIGDKSSMERMRALRQLDDKHNYTLICRDLSELSNYAKVDNATYRQLKHHTPGAFTFILNATKEVPKRLIQPKKKTIGMRVPDNVILQAILEELNEPLMSTSLIMPGDDTPLSDPYDIRQSLEHSLDLVIDGGYCGYEATTVLDLTDEEAVLLRQGVGDASAFLE